MKKGFIALTLIILLIASLCIAVGFNIYKEKISPPKENIETTQLKEQVKLLKDDNYKRIQKAQQESKEPKLMTIVDLSNTSSTDSYPITCYDPTSKKLKPSWFKTLEAEVINEELENACYTQNHGYENAPYQAVFFSRINNEEKINLFNFNNKTSKTIYSYTLPSREGDNCTDIIKWAITGDIYYKCKSYIYATGQELNQSIYTGYSININRVP